MTGAAIAMEWVKFGWPCRPGAVSRGTVFRDRGARRHWRARTAECVFLPITGHSPPDQLALQEGIQLRAHCLACRPRVGQEEVSRTWVAAQRRNLLLRELGSRGETPASSRAQVGIARSTRHRARSDGEIAGEDIQAVVESPPRKPAAGDVFAQRGWGSLRAR